MELTRRDALAALAAVGAESTAGCAAPTDSFGDAERRAEADLDQHAVNTLVAVAEAVYPSGVEGVPSFVREYSVARFRDDPEYASGVAEAVETLDDYVASFYDERYASLPAADRRALLSQMGVDDADPEPDGDDRERVRYYVVNELLYAFYTTPTGAGMAGIENPPGHPGGTRSYQRGPNG